MIFINDTKKAVLWQSLPVEGFEVVGIIDHENGDKGALAYCKESGRYVQLNAGVVKSLDQRKVKALVGIKSNAGAPPKISNGKRRNLYIANAAFEELKEIGNGNASLGLRKVLLDRNSP